MIELGKKVRFDPLCVITGFASEDVRGNYVTGTVVYINEDHGWFSAEYDSGGTKQRASYKFSQIGTDVMICG